MEGLGSSVGDEERSSFCTACFSGKYLTGNLNPGATLASESAPKLASA